MYDHSQHSAGVFPAVREQSITESANIMNGPTSMEQAITATNSGLSPLGSTAISHMIGPVHRS